MNTFERRAVSETPENQKARRERRNDLTFTIVISLAACGAIVAVIAILLDLVM